MTTISFVVKRTLLFIVLFFSQQFIQAQTTTPIEILFVGDSLTHGKYPPVLQYNKDKVTDLNAQVTAQNPRYERKVSEPGPWGGIPGLFKQFTLESGFNYNVNLEAISARSLSYHAKVAESENSNQANPPPIYQAKWDLVVLQDLSTGPLPDARGGKKDKFLNGFQTLVKGFHQASPKARVYLYQTWPIALDIYNENGAYKDIKDPLSALKTMTEDLYNGYKEAGKACFKVIPVGNAWFAAIEAQIALSNPNNSVPNQINLWAADGRHPSVYGAYLSALVIFATITNQDPRKLGYENAAKALGISSDVALKLQKIAYETTQKK